MGNKTWPRWLYPLFIVIVAALGATIYLRAKPGPISGRSENVFKQMFLSDYSTYRFRDTPVGNFGAGTIYDHTLLLDTNNLGQNILLTTLDGIFKEGVTQEQKVDELKKLVQSGSLGASSLREVDATGIGLNAIAPGVAKVLGIEGKSQASTGVRLTIRAVGALERKLAWNEFLKAIQSNLIDDRVVQQVKEQHIAIVVSDLTLLGYSTHLEIDSHRNADLNAKLSKAAGKPIQGDSGTSFTIQQTSSTSFDLIASEPVVIAQQFVVMEGAAAFALKNLQTNVNNGTISEPALASVERTHADKKPMLTSASVMFRTRDDDKDDDTRLSVFISKDDVSVAGSSEIANGIPFPNNSSNGPFNVPILKQILLSDMAGCKTRIIVQPNGHDTWHFDYTLNVTFSDGSTRTQKLEGQSLDQHYNILEATW